MNDDTTAPAETTEELTDLEKRQAKLEALRAQQLIDLNIWTAQVIGWLVFGAAFDSEGNETDPNIAQGWPDPDDDGSFTPLERQIAQTPEYDEYGLSYDAKFASFRCKFIEDFARQCIDTPMDVIHAQGLIGNPIAVRCMGHELLGQRFMFSRFEDGSHPLDREFSKAEIRLMDRNQQKAFSLLMGGFSAGPVNAREPGGGTFEMIKFIAAGNQPENALPIFLGQFTDDNWKALAYHSAVHRIRNFDLIKAALPPHFHYIPDSLPASVDANDTPWGLPKRRT